MSLQLKFLIAVQSAILLCGCTSSIRTDSTKLAKVKMKNGEYPISAVSPEASAAGAKVEIDMSAEAEISKQCLEAWRKALKGDGKGSIAQLDALEKKYPTFSTIKLMKGQVLDRIGRPEEAVKYYQESLQDSQFSSIRTFKLAQAYIRAKRYKEAEPLYRKIAQSYEDLLDPKLGLARSLLGQDKNSKEGKELLSKTAKQAGVFASSDDEQKKPEGKRVLEEILELDPANAEAKTLLEASQAKK